MCKTFVHNSPCSLIINLVLILSNPLCVWEEGVGWSACVLIHVSHSNMSYLNLPLLTHVGDSNMSYLLPVSHPLHVSYINMPVLTHVGHNNMSYWLSVGHIGYMDRINIPTSANVLF